MPREPMQSLWVGRRLSAMERLAIASFLHHGHPYHLFTYEGVENLPPGAVEEDARAILPESMIFRYREFPSVAGFSNYFRYKLLRDRGGWWVDTDVVCLRPFDFATPHVFASESTQDGDEVAASAVLRAPAGSEAMAHAWDACNTRDPATLSWGETGPRLVAATIARFGLDRNRQPARVFCPINYHEWRRLIEPDDAPRLDESTHALHLWNEMWRREGADKDASYPPGCLYERLKRAYPADPSGSAGQPG